MALVNFPEPDIRTHIDESTLATRLLDGAPVVLSILPDQFEQAVDFFREGFRMWEGDNLGRGGPGG